MDNGYWIGAWITGILAFIASWIYAIACYGFFLGVGLGWIPALCIGYLAGLIWPLLAIGVVAVIILIFA